MLCSWLMILCHTSLIRKKKFIHKYLPRQIVFYYWRTQQDLLPAVCNIFKRQLAHTQCCLSNFWQGNFIFRFRLYSSPTATYIFAIYIRIYILLLKLDGSKRDGQIGYKLSSNVQKIVFPGARLARLGNNLGKN